MSDEILNKTLELIRSSERVMPAHFSSNGDRTQSFCIDFEPLTPADDIALAAQAWGCMPSFVEQGMPTNEERFYSVLHCGEDIMVGAFIITKLGGEHLIPHMVEQIINYDIETFSTIPRLPEYLSHDLAKEYFDYCADFGKKRASE